MRKFIWGAVVLMTLQTTGYAQVNAGDFGLGLVAGDITGPTFKYFTGSKTAIDGGLKFDSDLEVYADYVWHKWDLFSRPSQGLFGGYFGVGPRYKERDGRGKSGDDQFGIRTMGGIDYWFDNFPLEIFMEAGPWFIFSPDTDTELDAGVGVRYYFQGSHGGRSKRRR